MGKQEIISVVGAGGKTTYIFKEKDRFVSAGEKVLITTTTHMALPKEGYDQTLEEISHSLMTKKWSICGRKVNHKGVEKLEGLPDDILIPAFALADVVLIEADGARNLPFKAPFPWEPVIHQKTTKIVIMAGLAALEGPIKDTCYNIERICEVTGKVPEDQLTEEDMDDVIHATYLKPLEEAGYIIPIDVIYTDCRKNRQSTEH